MKTIIYLIIVLVVSTVSFSACNKEQQDTKPQVPAKTQTANDKRTKPQANQKLDQIEAFAMKYSYAWSNQMADRVASFFAEDGILQVNDDPPSVGREAISDLAQGFMTTLPDMEVRFDSLSQGENGIEFHWTLIGTNSGPGGNGNKVNVSGYEEWTLNGNGLIERSQGHFPTEKYDKQINN